MTIQHPGELAGNLHAVHETDDQGKPVGGITVGVGVAITWQNGPMVIDGVELEQNGALVEDVIRAAYDRLSHFQGSEYANRFDRAAIIALRQALDAFERGAMNRLTFSEQTEYRV